MAKERRAVSRRTVFQFGRVKRPNEEDLLCTVSDLSAMGAKIEVENLLLIPDEFILIVDGSDTELLCRIIWKFGSKAGVALIMQPPVLQVVVPPRSG